MEPDIPGALCDLEKLADHLATLLEWEKLAEQEHDSRALPPFRLEHHNREDIIDLYSQFLELRSGIQRVIDEHDPMIPGDNRDTWNRRITALDLRVRQLGIMEKFIRP
ncbi:MAG: hypothetical protein H6819_06975 [Phycisphaerales bacterium]|nr:hypothetical protein [Phycisphaerales bacterium]MCB9855324.1 hypothetical protein [Phycisphaerales bacterium]MCB9862917.1 hypothetical protein [Phycisphaerales bacterium]